MRNVNEADLLDVLACEIDVRPKDAPTFEDLAPHVRSVRRTAGEIIVEFDAGAADDAAALVAAEQTCCADIGWELRREPAVELHITALPNQLDALYAMLQHAE